MSQKLVKSFKKFSQSFLSIGGAYGKLGGASTFFDHTPLLSGIGPPIEISTSTRGYNDASQLLQSLKKDCERKIVREKRL